MTQHIRKSYSLSSSKLIPTIIYEDNTICITQIKWWYIKCDRTKHISPKFFYAHGLEENGDIIVQQICSKDNLANLITKLLSTATFEKFVHNFGMWWLRDLKWYFYEGSKFYFCKYIWKYVLFFLPYDFYSLRFFLARF